MRVVSAGVLLVVLFLLIQTLLYRFERWCAERRARLRAKARYRAARTRERLGVASSRREAEIEHLNDMWHVS